MNDPFSYQPHALCIAAAGELQRSLPEIMSRYPEERGKMFGVLVVRRGDDLGYLQAYSGQLGGSYPLTDDFVRRSTTISRPTDTSSRPSGR